MNLIVTCIQNDVIARDPEANRRHLDEMLKTGDVYHRLPCRPECFCRRSWRRDDAVDVGEGESEKLCGVWDDNSEKQWVL